MYVIHHKRHYRSLLITALAAMVRGSPEDGQGQYFAIGHRLLATTIDGFIVPFEIVSLLLLIALVGAVVIAKKEKKV